MKAVIHTAYGPPDVLHLANVADPVPKDDEILVRVHATTVNRNDCGFRSAEYVVSRLFTGLVRPKRPILGTEFAGEVVAVGSRVSRFVVGERVFGRAQDDAMGAHAELMCIPEDGAVAHTPNNLKDEEAAAVCDGAMLASMYLRLVDFQHSPRILINGASGAIGSAGVQLAKARGATVIAVCKTEAVGIIENLGADHVIDYKKEDFTKVESTFDMVFDAVGKSSLSRCRKLLGTSGIYCSTELGDMWQNPIFALRTALFGGKIRVYFPIPKYLKSDVLYFKSLAENGALRPVIDRTYALEEIVEATRYVETGEKIGNVVVRLGR